jgi:hypothetical protein
MALGTEVEESQGTVSVMASSDFKIHIIVKDDGFL